MTRLPLIGADLGAARWALTPEADRYLRTVRRLSAGALVRAFDGAGHEATGRLEDGVDGWHLVRTGPVENGRAAAPITLVYGLPKGDKLDQVARQITELGAARLVLMAAERSVVRLAGDRARKRRDRLGRVMAEAARQSGRADAPVVAGPFDLAGALDATADCAARWVLHPEGGTALTQAPVGTPLALFVGPEGGFSAAELTALEAAGVHRVALDCPVLRTETAAPVALALALRQLEAI